VAITGKTWFSILKRALPEQKGVLQEMASEIRMEARGSSLTASEAVRDEFMLKKLMENCD